MSPAFSYPMKVHLSALRIGLLAALAMAILFIGHTATAQDVERGRPAQATPDHPAEQPDGPVIDRLAPPPTVASPTQADTGAQAYWLNCQPCHGDVGQGLTDEWRAQYPPEDQNCWESGCHGERPYDNGFTLPFTVPAIVGDGALTKFATAGALYRYMKVAMPFWKPGSLTDEDYLAITAHLAQEQGTWDGTTLTVDNADGMLLLAGLAAQSNPAAPTAPTATVPTATVLPAAAPRSSGQTSGILLWGGLALGILALAGGFLLWQRLNR